MPFFAVRITKAGHCCEGGNSRGLGAAVFAAILGFLGSLVEFVFFSVGIAKAGHRCQRADRGSLSSAVFTKDLTHE